MKKILPCILVLMAVGAFAAQGDPAQKPETNPKLTLVSPRAIATETVGIGKEKSVQVDMRIKGPSGGNLVFTDFDSLSPTITDHDGKEVKPRVGTDAASVPSKANILKPAASGMVDIKARLQFGKDRNEVTMVYYQPSGDCFMFRLEPGTYSLSFVYLVGDNTSGLFARFHVSSPALWHGTMTSNSITLQIK